MNVTYLTEQAAANDSFPQGNPLALNGEHVNSGEGKLSFYRPSPVFLYWWERNLRGLQ